MARIKSLKDLIYQHFLSLGLAEKYEQYMALAHWEKAVGKEIARHTDPFRVENGVIFVRVDNDVWRAELQYLKAEIMEKINQSMKKPVIRDIKFY